MMHSYSRKLRIAALAGALLTGIDAAHAAGITGFFVRKGVNYEQDSAAAPTPSAFSPQAFIARATGPSSEGTSVATPSQIFPVVELQDQISDGYQFSLQGNSDEIELFAPAGNYVFTFSDSAIAPLSFTANPFPTAVPQVSNFAATQAIDPASNFTLNFSPFTGAGANDSWEVQVVDSNTDTVFNKSGTTGTSVSIPANTLASGETYDAYVRFVHNVDSNTSAVPGVTGTAGYYNETHLQLQTTGSTGGGGGNPTLVATTPANGSYRCGPEHADNVHLQRSDGATAIDPMDRRGCVEIHLLLGLRRPVFNGNVLGRFPGEHDDRLQPAGWAYRF
jgi:hypothetical protein